MQIPKSSAQMDGLLTAVSAKLGISKETLKNELQSGKFDAALGNMKPQEAAVFQQVLQNPQKLSQIMNTKQAKALYEKLTKS